jgi:hypothetical protein
LAEAFGHAGETALAGGDVVLAQIEKAVLGQESRLGKAASFTRMREP